MSDDFTSSPTGQPSVLLPDWISSDLLEETISVWKSEYGEDLTTADAVGLLQTLVAVFENLQSNEEQHETSEQN